jgi:hypothetical protein
MNAVAKTTQACLILFIQLPLAAMGGNMSAAYRFEQGKDVFFMMDYRTGAEFVAFYANGTYRRIMREHMFVAHSDEGRWRQDSSGEILMCSSYRFRNLWHGEASIYLRGAEDLERLPGIRKEIEALVARSASEEIQVEGVVDGVSALMGKASKKDLEGLTRKIDAYLAAGDGNLFRARPGKYKQHVYLVMLSDGAWTQIDTEGIKKILDLLEPGQLPDRHLFYGINGTEFERESRKTQPFLYHPEMNERMERAGRQVLDMRGQKLDRSSCKGF